MKIKKLPVIFFLTMLLALNISNAFAKDEVDDALDEVADQYNKNKSNDNYKVVCKREAPLGSRIKREVCRTVAMVKNSQKEARKTMSRLRTTIGKQP